MNDNEKRQTLIDLIDYIRKEKGLTQSQIAKMAGYTQDNALAQVVSRKTGHEPAIRKLQIAFKDILQKDTVAEIEENAVPLPPIRRRSDNENHLHDFTNQSLFNLTESNRVLAESHKILAETNSKLADKVITASAPYQNSEVFSSMFSNLQEVILRVATGERFASTNEVAALLHKTDRVQASKVSAKGIQKD